jgi:hypothetical protein
MLNAFYFAVKAVDPRDVVATAGTAPNGDVRDGQGRMAPVRFWQALLCLGTPPKITLEPCPDPAHFDVLVHHPFSISDPDRPASSALDVSITDLGKLRRLLTIAQRTGRVFPASGTRLWATELNYDSKPPDPQGATARTLERWVPRALELLWRQGVDLVTWEFVRDPPSKLNHPAGLYQVDPAAPDDPRRDRPKPVLNAFRFPFTAQRTARGRVRLWALLPPRAGRTVSLQRRVHGRWRRIARVRANRFGLVDRAVALRGRAWLRLATPRRGASTRSYVTAGARARRRN